MKNFSIRFLDKNKWVKNVYGASGPGRNRKREFFAEKRAGKYGEQATASDQYPQVLKLWPQFAK